MMKRSRHYFELGVALIFASTALSGVKADETPGTDTGGDDTASKSHRDMSGPEMIRWVEEEIATAYKVHSRVQALLKETEMDKDVIKLTCLRDVSMQVEVTLVGVEKHVESLKGAVKEGDMSTARKQMDILQVYFSRISGLNTDMSSCVGERDIVLGKTETTTKYTGDSFVERWSYEDDRVFIDPPEHVSGFF